MASGMFLAYIRGCRRPRSGSNDADRVHDGDWPVAFPGSPHLAIEMGPGPGAIDLDDWMWDPSPSPPPPPLPPLPAPALPAPAAAPPPARRARTRPKPKNVSLHRNWRGKFLYVSCGAKYGGSFYVFLPDASDVKEFDAEVTNAMVAMNDMSHRRRHSYKMGATAFSFMKRYLRTSGWIIHKNRPDVGSVPLMSRKKHICNEADDTLST